MQEDLVHVLESIIEGLDDHLQWPSEQRREELANQFTGIFHGCIGIADVKEYQIVKLKDPMKERRSWSGKKKINSYKLLSVIDHSGRFNLQGCCWVRMIGRYTLLLLFTCVRASFIPMDNLLPPMVLLRVMDDLSALTKTPDLMRIELHLTMRSEKYGLWWKMHTKELVPGFPYWGITSVS
jgi:hypothetical protein